MELVSEFDLKRFKKGIKASIPSYNLTKKFCVYN